MKAIVTKYHGPTNFKGSRITASDEDGNKVTISYPHELSGEAVHRKAAQTLCDKMNWPGELVGGSLKNGYVFVFTERKADVITVLEMAEATIMRLNRHNSADGTLDVLRQAIKNLKS